MRRAILLLVVLAAGAAGAQPLVCPPETTASGRPCDTFHFHVQRWDPITRTFALLTGVNQFASQTACDRAREAAAKQNAAVVDFVKRVKQESYEADRIGPCHCDRTIEPGSAASLNDAQRAAQKRLGEEVRRHVRARLVDLDLPADAELVTGLWMSQSSNAMLGGPRLTQLPPPTATVVTNAPEDLRLPKSGQGSAPVATTFDLPLADLSGTPVAAPQAAAPAPVPATQTPPVATHPAAPPAAAPEPAPKPPIQETAVAVENAPTPPPTADIPVVKASEEESQLSAEDAADIFIRHETQRIQNVVNAVSDSPDETGDRILEACTARIQALTNLRSIILGSGSQSRIAKAARTTGADADRLALVTKLFGSGVAAHWMPKVTTDVLIPEPAQADANPEKVLRDSSGASTEEQRRRAFYALLTRAPITEEQQLWLIPVVDRFLQ